MKKIIDKLAIVFNNLEHNDDIKNANLIREIIEEIQKHVLPGGEKDPPIIRLQKKYANENSDDFHIENIEKYADWLEKEILKLLGE